MPWQVYQIYIQLSHGMFMDHKFGGMWKNAVMNFI